MQHTIQRLPLSLADTGWFQYFGNNVFAYEHGTDHNYDGYSQGLHGGIDFGVTAGTQVLAIATGTVTYVQHRGNPSTDQVRIRNGDFLTIYQHLSNIRVKVNDVIDVHDVIGLVANQGGNTHLHLEVRYLYKGKWYLINPLLLMAMSMRQSILGRFVPTFPAPAGSPSRLKYFYKTDHWATWITPLDQPVIRVGGPVIGPTAG